MDHKMADKILPGREIIFEMAPMGKFMRVMAMDTQTLTEVTVQGPVNASSEVLKANALKRLEYVMKKKGLI
jgi:hypothetical protein